MVLNDIVIQRKKDVTELKERMPLSRLQRIIETMPRPPARSFIKAITTSKNLNVIAELKKASPSHGVIREDFQPLRIANLYEYAGACAISVLTEPHFFKGRPSYLKTVRQVTTLPLLRKDFILEKYQLYETAILEADAFLLIAAILTEEELKELIDLGRSLGMDALVEVHNNSDLKKAVNAGAKMIGINNRNLKTLEIDPLLATQFIPKIPKGTAIVVESGLGTHEELMMYKSLGANAFLVGTSLIKSPDIALALQQLLGKQATGSL